MLYRSRKSKVIAGVCGGIAQKTGVNPILIRILAAVLVLIYGIGIPIYIILWLILESK